MFIMYFVFSFFLFILGMFLFILGMYFFSINLSVFMDWDIMTLNSGSLVMTLVFDYMSLIFLGCVFLISSMVVFYSDSYMCNDKYKYRFLILVMFFIFSMMMMIISLNLISILLGWDGLGLVSYCLVIYFQNYKSYNAGMLTILSNRIGDVAILISISWMMNFGSWNFMYYLYFDEDFMYIVFVMVVLASFTSSAQIPFSSWLPAAMAAPTPVSALVHSSTLVTAGVYLLIRFFPLIEFYCCDFILLLGLMTMFMSGLGANFEFDLKKIIALSTLSQLGLMMSILFLGFPKLAFFHLLTHAFFKSLLFLCSGLIIHVMNNSQDIRDMGHVIKLLPYTSSCFIISSFSLSGLPFLSGFYSSDIILESVFIFGENFFNYFIFMISVSFTMSYTFRLFNILMFSGNGNYCFQNYSEDFNMMFSMILLVFLSIFGGFMLSWLMSVSPFFMISSVFVKLMPLISVILGIFFGLFFSNFNMNFNNYSFNFFLIFTGSMWYMPVFSTYIFYSFFFNISFIYNRLFDMGWVEYIFSKSHVNTFYSFSKFNYLLEYNNVKLFLTSFLFLFMILLI